MTTKIVPVGAVFGRLTVTGVGEPFVAASGKKSSSSVTYCECGTTKAIRNSSLREGSSRSCGCLHNELSSDRGKTHGMKGAPEYAPWKAMCHRCTNTRQKNFSEYGGRGIAICESWLDINNFVADMGPRPSPSHTIDRIDNNIGYCKENCRWATRAEQANNKRNNKVLLFYGKAMTLTQWSLISQVDRRTISSRLKAGWTEKAAVWTPVRKTTSSES